MSTQHVAVYLRTSTTPHADPSTTGDPLSLDEQQDLCLQRARPLEAEVVDIYKDEGATALQESRTE